MTTGLAKSVTLYLSTALFACSLFHLVSGVIVLVVNVEICGLD